MFCDTLYTVNKCYFVRYTENAIDNGITMPNPKSERNFSNLYTSLTIPNLKKGIKTSKMG